MKNTPKPYLSYSQLSTLEHSEKNYIQSYIWGHRSEENDFLKLGKKLAVALEHRESIDEEWIEVIKKQMPDYPKREYTIETQLSNIPIMGVLDGFNPKGNIIGEYKTGLKQNIAGWTDQMIFYSLLIWLKKRSLPKKIELFWAKTKWNDEEQLIFVGEVKKFDIKIDIKDILRFIPRITKAWKKIQELVENERLQYGQLPFDDKDQKVETTLLTKL
jgi:hypothetical protein